MWNSTASGVPVALNLRPKMYHDEVANGVEGDPRVGLRAERVEIDMDSAPAGTGTCAAAPPAAGIEIDTNTPSASLPIPNSRCLPKVPV